MTSSRWHAHGNVYLVLEGEPYVHEDGLDGAVDVLSVDGDDMTIAIVNPDGSHAEMSGNGTRIAGAWLMERTGHDDRARARRPARRRGAAHRRASTSRRWGRSTVHERERIAGFERDACRPSATRTRSSSAIRTTSR